MGFDDFEISPAALILAGIGGLVTVVVMKQVAVSMMWKVLGFVFGSLAGFLVASWRLNAD